MTRNEAAAIIDRLGRLYMLQMRKMSREDKRSMIDVWADTFKDTSYDIVLKAVNLYANTGKAFLPNPPDIINEILKMDEGDDSRLFARLVDAAKMVVQPEKHIVIDDLGGYRWSEEHQREVYFHPECHYTTNYTQSDFTALPIEIQMYAEDIQGLRMLDREIQSDYLKSRRRFLNALPYIRNKLQEVS